MTWTNALDSHDHSSICTMCNKEIDTVHIVVASVISQCCQYLVLLVGNFRNRVRGERIELKGIQQNGVYRVVAMFGRANCEINPQYRVLYIPCTGKDVHREVNSRHGACTAVRDCHVVDMEPNNPTAVNGKCCTPAPAWCNLTRAMIWM
jgi:hypothetical protein